LLLAKNQAAAGAVGRAFQAGLVAKGYLALGSGPRPERDSFQVAASIAKEGSHYVARAAGPGQAALTGFTVLDQRDFAAVAPGMREVLFRAEPRTGRTHQIRLHLAWAGWPIRGDLFYGRAEAEAALPAGRLMLAAVSLGLDHPGRPGRLELSLEPQMEPQMEPQNVL
jgi:23S rRNA pseudouridine1911/1915/1917 synthase